MILRKRLNAASPINWLHPLNRGLVGWWMAPEGWQGGSRLPDLLGRNPGTLTNMDPATDWVGTQYGPALDFDGTNDYVATPSIAYSGEFTAWFDCVNGALGAVRAMMSKAPAFGSAGDWYMYAFSDGAVRVDIPFVIGSVVVASTSFYTAGERRMWALRRTGTTGSWTYKIYRDGVEIASATTASNPNTGSHRIELCSYASANNTGNHRILSAGYVGRACSAAEIYGLYDQSRRGFPDQLNWIDAPQAYAEVAAGGATRTGDLLLLGCGA